MTKIALHCLGALIVKLALFAVPGEPTALSQISPAPQGKVDNLSSVASELKGTFGDVRFHREETLEDRFMSHGLQPSMFVQLPRFFQLQEPRFILSRGGVMENSTNALPTMYVASSPDGEKVYRLYGFPKAEEEFNRLVADTLPEKIGGSEDAESRRTRPHHPLQVRLPHRTHRRHRAAGLLCGEVVYGLASQWWVADPSSAKLQMAEHFFSTGHKNGLLLGEKWWESIKGDRAALRIQVVKNEDGSFSVNLPVFWAPVEGTVVPQIKIYRIEVGENGACHMNRQPISVLK